MTRPTFDLLAALQELEEAFPGIPTDLLAFYDDGNLHIRVIVRTDKVWSNQFIVTPREVDDSIMPLLREKFDSIVEDLKRKIT